MKFTTRNLITVIAPILQAITNVKYEGITIVGTTVVFFILAVTSDFRREERHLGVISGMGPYP